jgi:FG-GAP repeat
MHAGDLASRAIFGTCVLALAMLLASCKGPIKEKYTVGGSVSGLARTGLMLQNNGRVNLAIPSDGGFTFPGPLDKGETYNVTVRTEPSGQSCTVANGTGIVNTNVTNVAVNCGGNAVTIGGTVSGLAGGGFVLQNNAGDDLGISADGPFTFPTAVAGGATYSVTVLMQPSAPSQTCTVTGGDGTAGANVTNVAVNCITDTHTVGGTVSGLAGAGLVLQNNGGDDLSVPADGAFTFATPVVSGGPYGVAVLSPPAGQACTVFDGSGTIGSANVASVAVVCMGPPSAPAMSLGFGVKELRFSWLAVSGATYYRLLENPDGVSGYTQVESDVTATSVNHTIPVHLRVNASYVLEACNPAGCTASAPQSIGASLTQAIGYFKASNTGAGDQFGFAVALSGDGNTLAVGARNEDSGSTGIDSTPDESAPNSGAVYVFVRSAGGWLQQAYVKASNAGAGDSFGTTVALSGDGNTLAVGAPFEASSSVGIGSTPDDAAPAAGAAYVFARSAGTWSQQAYVKASNTGASDLFGNSVALSGDGNTLVVGAPFEGSSTTGINSTPNDAALRAGAAYVFVRGAGSWSQQAYVKASNTGAGDQFATAVAVSDNGSTVAVGAPREDSSTTGINSTPSDPATNFDAGAVYVFVRTGAAWVQQAYVKASNTGSGDQFGVSVALSWDGDTLATGALREDSDTTGIDSVPNEAALDAGAAYVFTRINDLWSQQAYVKPLETRIGEQFGASVALSGDGNALAVGAPLENLNGTGINSTGTAVLNESGAAFFFARSAGAWSQKAYVKASNTGADHFGGSVALSGDGNTFAVGAMLEDGSGTGIDSTPDDLVGDSGAVYLY